MWMHNGGVGAWKHVKRRLASSLGDQWFNFVQGSTDSEWCFALFLDCMERMGHLPDTDVGENGFGHTVLRKAMLKTIERINALLKEVPATVKEEDKRSLLNFAVTDGNSVVCTRYVSSETDEAASLFFSSGTSWKEQRNSNIDADKKDYKMERKDKGADIVLVASEPLTFERGEQHPHSRRDSHPLTSFADNWVTVPTNSTLTIHKQTVMIHPIVDEYYVSSLQYVGMQLELTCGIYRTRTLRTSGRRSSQCKRVRRSPDRTRLPSLNRCHERVRD